MMNKKMVLGVLTAIFVVSCAGTPAVPKPAWVADMSTAYPESRFIAMQGRGITKDAAQLAALGDLAGYFEREVQQKESAYITMIQKAGGVEKEKGIANTITVTVRRNLSTVRYADDAWKDPVTGEYVTVAYLNREEAWAAFFPQAEKAANTFFNFYFEAEKYGKEKDADPFTLALQYGEAQQYAAGEEFATTRVFAQLLDAKQAVKLFEEADPAHAALPELTVKARRNASIYIDCPLDLDGLVSNAAAAVFGEAGFPVARERRSAAAVCVIRVNEGSQKLASGTYYYPNLSVEVSGRAGPVFSFTAEAERQGAINPELARRRAYTALAQALRDTLPGQIPN
jgi:hypothetical protein